ncbi:divergent PAP2 family protein [Candidatus Saccharibacteria bacterium]|nr:divergent PAP2 family protein [Candidatus Saccharibacteria bacterium]
MSGFDNVVNFATIHSSTSGLNWENILQIFSPYLVAAVLGYAVAQATKVVILRLRGQKPTWREFFQSGRIPSSHTAFVVAPATVVGLVDGFGSALFAIAAVLVIVVVYDATHVRRSVGEQGEVLRAIIDRDARQEKEIARLTPEDDKPGKKFTKPYFSRGHKPIEVIVGALLGALIGLLVYLIY